MLPGLSADAVPVRGGAGWLALFAAAQRILDREEGEADGEDDHHAGKDQNGCLVEMVGHFGLSPA